MRDLQLGLRDGLSWGGNPVSKPLERRLQPTRASKTSSKSTVPRMVRPFLLKATHPLLKPRYIAQNASVADFEKPFARNVSLHLFSGVATATTAVPVRRDSA